MKEVKAYIKAHELSKVILALQKIDGLTGMSVSKVRRFGRGRAGSAPEKITEDFVDYGAGSEHTAAIEMRQGGRQGA